MPQPQIGQLSGETLPGTTMGDTPSTQTPAQTSPNMTTPGGLLNSGIQGLGRAWQHIQSQPLPNMPQGLNIPVGQAANDIRTHGLPNNFQQAMRWHEDLNDPNQSMLSGSRATAGTNLVNWLDQNQNHPLVSRIRNAPSIQNQLSMARGPIGSIASTVLPGLNDITRDPQRFSTLLSMPVIRDLYQNTLGMAGIPGLALGHGLLSGNMRNWNTLTEGLRNPEARVPGRNAYNELAATPGLGQLMPR